MTTSLALVLMGLAGFALLALVLRMGVIGVRGGSLHRADSPLVYWVAIVVLAIASAASIILGFIPG
jgi:hypothetical protein